MRIVITTLTATALLLTTAGAVLADCRAGDAVPVGAVSGDMEKDTFGLVCDALAVEQTGSVTSASPRTAMPVGAVMGEPEKDTLGYALAASVE